jgi:hypothetical protein
MPGSRAPASDMCGNLGYAQYPMMHADARMERPAPESAVKYRVGNLSNLQGDKGNR